MTASAALLVRKYFETDPGGATRQLEGMDEADVAAVLRDLPPVTGSCRSASPRNC